MKTSDRLAARLAAILSVFVGLWGLLAVAAVPFGAPMFATSPREKYEVDITTRSQNRHGLCNRLAASYLPEEPRLRWPPPYLRDPDLAPSVVCVLSRGAGRVEIDYGPADSGRLDAESICDALIDRGWKRSPAWEGLDRP
jgi:hypothetical protein